MRLYYDELVYKKHRLLDEGNINVELGCITLIKGMNGSGKSTLVRNAFLNDKNMMHDMVYVDQNSRVAMGFMDVLMNISMSCDKKRNQDIKERLIALDFGFLLDKNPFGLSGGEKRLVYLLRGLFSDEKIVIIDEPTNDLDNDKVMKVASMLKEFSKTKAIVIISHDSRMQRIADKIYVIKDQKITCNSDATTNSGKLDFREIKKDKRIFYRLIGFNFVSVLLAGLILYVYIQKVSDYEVNIMNNNADRIYECNDKYLHIKAAMDSLRYESAQSRSWVSAILMPGLAGKIEEDSYIGLYKDLNNQKNNSTGGMTRDEFEKLLEKIPCSIKGLGYHDEESFSIYPLEWYDNERKIHIEIEEYCFGIESEEYEAYAKELCNLYEVSYAVVVFKNNKGLTDFIDSEYYDLLCDSDAGVRYSGFMDDIRTLKGMGDCISVIYVFLRVIVVIVLSDVIYLFIYMKINKEKLLSLRNYDYDRDDITSYMVSTSNGRVLKLAMCAIAIWYGIKTVNRLDDRGAIMWPIVFCMIFSLTYGIEAWIMRQYMKKVYDWRFQ